MTTATPASRPDIWMPGALTPYVIEQVERRGRLLRGWEIPDPDAYLAEHGGSIRVIVTGGPYRTTRALMEQLPALEAIVSHGVGYDTIDIEAARERGIAVSNTPGVLDDCVADLALTLLLSTARRLCEADRHVRSGLWETTGFGLSTSLRGKRCGILGLGNIGVQIARRAEAFGMEIAYCNRKPRPGMPAHYRHVSDPVALARESDFLVVATPGGAQTRHLVDARVLEALGPAGHLINISRGSVVDEAALIDALAQGRIAGAGLDVYADEPRVPQALRAMDNVTLTPHMASATRETRRAMADLLLANLDAWLARRALLTPVV